VLRPHYSAQKNIVGVHLAFLACVSKPICNGHRESIFSIALDHFIAPIYCLVICLFIVAAALNLSLSNAGSSRYRHSDFRFGHELMKSFRELGAASRKLSFQSAFSNS
jgi:hypothetical protein